MDRLHQVALERRAAADRTADRTALRLLGVAALVVVGIAAVGMGVLSVQVFRPRDAGILLGVVAACGWPMFRLGRRHARRD